MKIFILGLTLFGSVSSFGDSTLNYLSSFFDNSRENKIYSQTLDDLPLGTTMQLKSDVVVNANGFIYRDGTTHSGGMNYYYSCRLMLDSAVTEGVKRIERHDSRDELPVVTEVENYNETEPRFAQLARKIHFESSGMINSIDCYFADRYIEPKLGHIIDIFPEINFNLNDHKQDEKSGKL